MSQHDGDFHGEFITPSGTDGANYDEAVVRGFGDEWSRFDQAELGEDEHRDLFESYFKIFPWSALPTDAVGADIGSGSGRWAKLVAPRVGQLHCVDASQAALEVSRRNLAAASNVQFHCATVGSLPFDNQSLDFAYSLGVLHHVPDIDAAVKECVRTLKLGAPFLIYLYYAFDNRPFWFRMVWRVSDLLRRPISRFPLRLRYVLTQALAGGVYWPMARTARVLERVGLPVSHMPLAAYRHRSFYTMRTDALDRFGTRLEQRFTREQIEALLRRAGLVDIQFHDDVPFWCALGWKPQA